MRSLQIPRISGDKDRPLSVLPWSRMPRAPALSKDAVFWFAVITALAFLPTLISVLSGPVQAGGGGVYV